MDPQILGPGNPNDLPEPENWNVDAVQKRSSSHSNVPEREVQDMSIDRIDTESIKVSTTQFHDAQETDETLIQ